MLKFWFYKYKLKPVAQIGALAVAGEREGALLKMQWPDGAEGYADLFPWPELGDLALDDQLRELKALRLTALAEQSIWMARKEALLRREKKSAFKDLTKVKSHYLVADYTRIKDTDLAILPKHGFRSVKVKLGKNPEEDIKWTLHFLKTFPLNLRIDFNSQGTLESFEKFAAQISRAAAKRIEFVEDPFPYNLEDWRKANELLPLAIDNEESKVEWENLQKPVPFKVVVLKPARQDVKKTVNCVNKFLLKMVVTSSLDHPVGVAHAAWVAGELKKYSPNTLLDCGVLSHKNYQADLFSDMIKSQGPTFLDVPGTGVGFDSLLEKILWQSLDLV